MCVCVCVCVCVCDDKRDIHYFIITNAMTLDFCEFLLINYVFAKFY